MNISKSSFFDKLNLKRGFTLAETIIIISLYTILSLAIFSAVFYLYQSNSYTIDQSNEVENARKGLYVWLDDVKEMNFADDGAFPLALMDTNQMGFYSDIDDDPSVEYIEYILSTTTLYKRVYEASGYPPVYNFATSSKVETLSEYVQNIDQGIETFTYFDTDGVKLSTTTGLLTDVRYFEVNIVVNIDPLRSPGEFLLQSGAVPRNLKDNL
ncbi:MAG: hypothetical protein R3B60_01615 [Candidatus Paceibacterota bacterium]